MYPQPRGFTIFFASLVTALALAIGLAIYDLTVRELDLSATASQSQYAIYAADTGAECALYIDTKCSAGNCIAGSAFATSTETDGGTFPPTSGVVCNAQDVAAVGTPPAIFALPPTGWTAWTKSRTISTATTTFWMPLSSTLTGPCVRVEVGKYGTPTRTLIIAHGYNTCLSGVTQLERALQVSY